MAFCGDAICPGSCICCVRPIARTGLVIAFLRLPPSTIHPSFRQLRRYFALFDCNPTRPRLQNDFSQREKPHFAPGGAFCAGLEDGDYIYSIIRYDYSLLKIDKKTRAVEKVKLRFKDEKHKPQATSPLRFKYRQQYLEHMFFTVENFIDGVLNREIPQFDEEAAEFFKSLIENTDGTAGNKIHKYVMEALERDQ